MELLCIGDVGLVDPKLAGRVWPHPLDGAAGEDVRVLFNWELPVGDTFNPIPRKCGGPRLMSFPASPQVIRNWSPGFAALATNHMLDAGEQGLRDTLDALAGLGFTTTGAGITREEITRPLIWETQEGKLAVINWVFPETNPDWMAFPGPNFWPGVDEAQKRIAALKQENDWVMVLAHWSDELFPYPRPEDRTLARLLVQAGLDVFVGHHPHVVRGMEIMEGCPVYYSLGNFYFSEFSTHPGDTSPVWAPRNREALGLSIAFKRGFRPACTALSYWQEGDQTIADAGRRAQRRMERTSHPLNRYHGEEYGNWYSSQRRFFESFSAKWHFGVRKRGFIGSLRHAFRRLLSLAK